MSSSLESVIPASVSHSGSGVQLRSSLAIGRIEQRTVRALAQVRANQLVKSALVEVDRQLGEQVVDAVGDVTERSIRRYADIQETVKLRPGLDAIDQEERHVLQLAGLLVMRSVIAEAGDAMTTHAFGRP